MLIQTMLKEVKINATMILLEQTLLSNKQARLKKIIERVHEELPRCKKSLRVKMTLNQLSKLSEKCLHLSIPLS